MMIEFFLSLALFAQDAVPAETADTPIAEAEAFDPQAALAGVNGWINSIETYRARFDQVADDGSHAGGTLSIRRPGRLRFEYDDPSPLLVVADGTTVAMEDSDLETVDRVPLRSTPLWWLLKPDVDLAEDARVTDVFVEDNRLYVDVEDRNDEMDGQARFVFNTVTYALEEWFVADSLGYVTRVTLSDVETDVRLNPRLFVLDEPEDERRNRRQ
ncbi:outer-membrane lipoprotein carrier protein LolA [Hyphobacterium sp. HN65]|uniref:Outer-membrane lipoprotein carrier protein LolA n=1 Tax=Hyphobacterium lacteum TaxID=3116575 RepID=A0ABU7LST4_9PROT|nr:outer-membrane lipoprotein carrier protein LolA [Hyphobacterium sp. HN65]MEE2526957.1 outer-membrane lipoprotein carrier protein LolA [Hyphobacterium sp. HN65]